MGSVPLPPMRRAAPAPPNPNNIRIGLSGAWRVGWSGHDPLDCACEHTWTRPLGGGEHRVDTRKIFLADHFGQVPAERPIRPGEVVDLHRPTHRMTFGAREQSQRTQRTLASGECHGGEAWGRRAGWAVGVGPAARCLEWGGQCRGVRGIGAWGMGCGDGVGTGR